MNQKTTGLCIEGQVATCPYMFKSSNYLNFNREDFHYQIAGHILLQPALFIVHHTKRVCILCAGETQL